MTFHEKLKRMMVSRNRRAVSRMLGMSNNYLNGLLYEQKMPAADTAQKLARILAVDIDWLFDDRQNWPPMRVIERRVAEEYAEMAA